MIDLERLAEEFVVPDYGGRTLANVPATVAALLGAPFNGLPPLYEEYWRPFQGSTKRVIVQQHSYITSADLFVQLRQLLEATAGDRLYINAYWPAIDTLTHLQGPEGASVAAELHAVLAQLKTELLEPLSPAARAGTVLFITGDHGQIRTTPEHSLNLAHYQGIVENMLMRPAGEPRVLYLYARQGKKAALIDYINQTMPEAAMAFDADEVLASGLLGPMPHAPSSRDRMGDVVVLMRHNYLLVDPDEAHKVDLLLGRHGGLTADEMEIPWLGLKL